jgi:hypothetical protein
MELIEEVKLIYPIYGTVKTSKMLGVRQEIIKGIVDENKLRKNGRINIDDFYNIEKKEIAYSLGLIWADGYLSKKRNSLGLECVADDMVHFKKVLDKIGRWSYYYRDRDRNGIKCQSLTNAHITDSLLHKFLEENDYLEKSKKSSEKIVSKIPSELVRYFFLGMIDGDGCFYFKKNVSSQFTISGTEEQDWSCIENIFKSKKIKYTIVVTKSSSAIRITNKKDIKKIGDYVYSTIESDNIGLKRKYEKYKLIISSLRESDEILEYINRNRDKSIKDLSSELKISRFKLNKIFKKLS